MTEETRVAAEELEDVVEEEMGMPESDSTLCPARRIISPTSIWNPSPLSQHVVALGPQQYVTAWLATRGQAKTFAPPLDSGLEFLVSIA